MNNQLTTLVDDQITIVQELVSDLQKLLEVQATMISLLTK